MSMVIRKNRDDEKGTVTVSEIKGILPKRSLPKEYLNSEGPIVFAHELDIDKFFDSASFIDNELPGFTIVLDNRRGARPVGIQVKVGDVFTFKQWDRIRSLVETAGELLHNVNQQRNNSMRNRCTDVI